MRIILMLTFFILYGSFNAIGQYEINKTKYNSRDYVPKAGDPYNPIVCGFASYLLPGLGQIIANEPTRGLLFTGAYLGSFAVVVVGTLDMGLIEPHKNNSEGAMLLVAGMTSGFVIWVWSIGDAVKVAKINNLAYRDKKNTSYNMELVPYYVTNINEKQASYIGLSLKINY